MWRVCLLGHASIGKLWVRKLQCLTHNVHSACCVEVLTHPHMHTHALVRHHTPLHLQTNTGGVDKRYSLDGIRGIYDDLMLLSSADFNVGTLSSQIGRLTYELSQVNGSTEVSDRSLHFHSLDVRW